jgi:hypothetical protein
VEFLGGQAMCLMLSDTGRACWNFEMLHGNTSSTVSTSKVASNQSSQYLSVN